MTLSGVFLSHSGGGAPRFYALGGSYRAPRVRAVCVDITGRGGGCAVRF